MLTLAEELLLIFIDDATGAIAPIDAVQCGLAGAILSDLALRGKIYSEDKRMVVVDPTPTGDEILDGALEIMAAYKKTHKVKYWIGALGGRKLVRRIARQLVASNILRLEKKHYLWVVPYDCYPQQDASAKYWVKQHLRAVVLGGEKPDLHDLALLSLLKASRFLNMLFTRGERKAADKKVDGLVAGNIFGEAVTQTLEEIDKALLATILATTGS
jgi:golgi phosphoprotein 3